MRRLQIFALAVVGLIAFTPALGCSGNRAYLDWRAGLSEIDFEGLFEISLDEYDAFADAAEANVTGEAVMAEFGERIQGGSTDPEGGGILELADGRATVLVGGGETQSGAVDWFSATPDGESAVVLVGTRLSVLRGQASTGIDLGSLLGTSLDRHHFLMMVEGQELNVFALPEVGGVVAANEVGYLIAFRHGEGKRHPWTITVARVVVTL